MPRMLVWISEEGKNLKVQIIWICCLCPSTKDSSVVLCSLHVKASASSTTRLHPQLGAEEARSQTLPTCGTLARRSVTKGSSTFLLLHFLLSTPQITSFPVLGKPSQLLKHSQESFPLVKANIYICCALRGSGYDQLSRQDLAERDDLLKWINKTLWSKLFQSK